MNEDIVCGIDVSHYQGSIDWDKVTRGGIAFAYIKATDGEHGADPNFANNWREAKRAGLFRGAYHFFRPQQDAERQAQHFLELLAADWGELPPVLDFEVAEAMPVHTIVERAQLWLSEVERGLGHKPVLYTCNAFWSDILNNSELFSENPLWIAHYTKAGRPKFPAAWKDWALWQYSQDGTVEGITGKVDLDKFHGTLFDLAAFCMTEAKSSRNLGSFTEPS